eukprot:2997518-Rhodomonas_salina.2
MVHAGHVVRPLLSQPFRPRLSQPRQKLRGAWALRGQTPIAPYAMSGTDIAEAVSILGACYAMSGTDMAYAVR